MHGRMHLIIVLLPLGYCDDQLLIIVFTCNGLVYGYNCCLIIEGKEVILLIKSKMLLC